MSGMGSVAIISTRAGASGSRHPEHLGEAPGLRARRDHDEHPRRTCRAWSPDAPSTSPAALTRVRSPSCAAGSGRRGPAAPTRSPAPCAAGLAWPPKCRYVPPIALSPTIGTSSLSCYGDREAPSRKPRISPTSAQRRRERQLRLAERHPDAVGLVLGRVAEQLVHLRPEPLLLETEGAVDVRGAAAVAARRLPADDAPSRARARRRRPARATSPRSAPSRPRRRSPPTPRSPWPCPPSSSSRTRLDKVRL